MIDFEEVQRRGAMREARCESPDCPNCSVTTRPAHAYIVEPVIEGMRQAFISGDKTTLLTADEVGWLGYLIGGMAVRLDAAEQQLGEATEAAHKSLALVDEMRKGLRRVRRTLQLGDAVMIGTICIVVGMLIKHI